MATTEANKLVLTFIVKDSADSPIIHSKAGKLHKGNK